ncbi:siderophore-interacting protein [Thioclava sp. GXIMD4215]|uniref:siderophore-interacting protein n=1 Tax=Thioclava sp. GXIMD4215 TaxID=3131928 RepID=UPI00324AB4B2
MTDLDSLPRIERQRHELVRRTLTVSEAHALTPHMIRIVLTGPELEGFTSTAPDDHFKLMIPDANGEKAMRDYTPRHFDPETLSLTVDFALHEAGPATLWAKSAKVGDTVMMGGPRGSQNITGPIQRWVLIGDETALPAIARRLFEMEAGTPVTTLVGVPEAADEQDMPTKANHLPLWVHRTDATDPAPLLEQLKQIPLGEGTFVWIAAEASVARALRDHLQQNGHPLPWMKAAGYWVAGQADASDKSL